MGLWHWLSGREPRLKVDAGLVRELLADRAARTAQEAELAKMRFDLDKRKLELEFENVSAIGEQKRADMKMAEEIRATRRAAAKENRKKREENLAKGLPNGRNAFPGEAIRGCKVCNDPSNPTLTAHEIMWHHEGHPGAAVQVH